jgi:ribonuclease VapC
LNTSKLVLDSYAVLAYLRKEPDWERVRELLSGVSEGGAELHISVINLAEVQYRILRVGKDTERALGAVAALPLIVASADAHIPAVVQLKARYAVSLADCFAVALAQELDCPVLTGDPEFRKLEELVTIEWLG